MREQRGESGPRVKGLLLSDDEATRRGELSPAQSEVGFK